jgi:hypothetical protein
MSHFLLWSTAMPRPRKNDPSSLITPIIEQFAWRLASVVEKFTVSRIEEVIQKQSRGLKGRQGGRSRGKRAVVLCYYPGCKNIAAPRFGMFCAAEHKRLSKTEKEKYRAQHLAGRGAARPARGSEKVRRRRRARA